MQRFVKIGGAGEQLPSDAPQWVAVLDTTTGLTWSAGDVTKKRVVWKKAKEACAKLKLCGHADWRLPTIEELFLLADRTRCSPAIDATLFPTCQSSWYWSSSPAAWAPAGGAWFVYFGDGYASGCGRGGGAFVRAVRSAAPASQ